MISAQLLVGVGVRNAWNQSKKISFVPQGRAPGYFDRLYFLLKLHAQNTELSGSAPCFILSAKLLFSSSTRSIYLNIDVKRIYLLYVIGMQRPDSNLQFSALRL